MRKILRFGVALSVAYLVANAGMAFAQRGAAGQAENAAAAVLNPTQAGTTPAVPTTPGGLGQQAAQAAGITPATGATAPPTTPGGLGQQAAQAAGITPAAGANSAFPGQAVSPATPATSMPANTYQVPGTMGTMVNPAGTPVVNPANTTTYSSNYYAPGTQQPVYTQPGSMVTPGYTNRVMPGMAGYNTVNPMPTTMTPGSYYAGTAGTPYTTTGYSPMYYTNAGNYTTQPQYYPVRQRRGLFGGLFQRRNRVVYPASPYTTTYAPTTYTPTNYVYSTSPY
jgi:hypothetical protein